MKESGLKGCFCEKEETHKGHPEFISGSTPLVTIQNKEEMLKQVQHDNGGGFTQTMDYLSLEGEGGTPCRVRGKDNKANPICTPSSALRASSPSRGKWTCGFTLIELLVVVLIIGILAAIAIPKYQVAVEKTRATQMLPMMRHIYDALAFYKLQNGEYYKGDGVTLTWDDLGIEPPAGFETNPGNTEYWNDTWYCFPNEESSGYVYCQNEKYSYRLFMFQPDDPFYSEFAGKRICEVHDDGVGAFGEKVCKALGGKELEETLWGGKEKVFEF